MSQLAIKSLAKAYGAFEVFEGLDLEAEAGEIVVIFGGSGTGKTILLRLIAGVEEPTSGSIELMGQDATDVAPEHRGVGMAFQNFALFPHMSASDNIAAPLMARRAPAEAVRRGVDRVAKLLKIDHVLGHSPRELSNGQKQRTALARALAAAHARPATERNGSAAWAIRRHRVAPASPRRCRTCQAHAGPPGGAGRL